MGNSPPNWRYILTLGFALFAIFFGAGNLIFPPTLGRMAGDRYVLSTLGFLLTGVGLPLMGILSVAKAEGGIEQIASRVDSRVAKILTIVIMLAIGPLLAIPRTCATTYELGILPSLPFIGSWTFSFIYFAVVLFFALNPLSVVDRIGKILTPVLLASLAFLIFKGIADPISVPVSTPLEHPFGKGFVEGYQTMDLLAATIFGMIILNEIRSKGIFNKAQQVSSIVKAGLIAASCLALVYCGLFYLGATTSGLFDDISRTKLLSTMATRLMGNNGNIVLGIAVSMACLTTAIGIIVVCGQFFNKISYGKLNYKMVCVVVAAISFVLANAGVEMIVRIAVPPLVALYPMVMVMVILTLLGERLGRRNIWRGAVIGAFAVGLMDAIRGMGLDFTMLNTVYEKIPFTAQGLGWVVPAFVLGALGAIKSERERPIYRVLTVCPSQLFTRVAIYEDRVKAFEAVIPHNLNYNVVSGEAYGSQLLQVKGELLKKLKREFVDLSKIDAVVARGGFLKPLPSGTYRISKNMLDDLEKNAQRQHPSNWGALLAYEIATANNVEAYVVDPVVVDEMEDVAKFSGLPEIQRASIFHASNQKAVVRHVAKNLWKRPDQVNVIVAHIGEGTSVGAHYKGRVVDVNNALDGDGPFSSLNAGSLPVVDVVKMCFESGMNEERVLHRIRCSAGLFAYVGKTDVKDINKMVESNEGEAVKAVEAMGYQVSKEICSLAATLEGRVDAIAITGEFASCPHLVRYIKSRVRFLAPIFVYPGESETFALTEGVLRVLHGQEKVLDYS